MAVLDFRRDGPFFGGGGTLYESRTTLDGELAIVRPVSSWMRLYVHRSVLVDAAACGLAGIGAYLARWGFHWDKLYVAFAAVLPLLWVAVVAANRGYESRFLGVGTEEFRRVGRAAISLSAMVTFVAYAAHYSLARGFVLVVLPSIGLFALVGRYGLRKWLHRRRIRGEFMHRVVLVGEERPVRDLMNRLGEERSHGLQVVAACLPDGGQRGDFLACDVPVLGGYGSVARTVRLVGADTVAVLASSDLGSERLRTLAWDLEPTGAALLVAPSLVEVAGPRLSIRPVSGLPLLHVEQPSFSGGRRLLKGAFDRSVAALALLVLAPLLMLVVVAIRLDSPGPAVFKQLRVGKDGRSFRLYKFRSMVADAEAQREELLDKSDRDGLMFKMRQDPRVTRVGAWLRRYSIDELPQLVNVVLGQMSLVGPRPPLPDEVDQYAGEVHRRLLVLPGITGLWQVSGRSDLSWEESVRLDLRYVDNWSFALDLQILWKTANAVLAGHGAY